MTVIGAYGRDYKNSTDALADWEGGKDFQIVSVGRWMGSYISNRDGIEVSIRYDQKRKIVQTEKRT